jgi:hypothetical protein
MKFLSFSQLFSSACRKCRSNPYFSFISVPRSKPFIVSFFKNPDNRKLVEIKFTRRNLEKLRNSSTEIVGFGVNDGDNYEAQSFFLDALETGDEDKLVAIAQIIFALAIPEKKELENPYSFETPFENSIKEYERTSLDGTWFRGQTDAKWGLMPSLLREIDCPENAWIDFLFYKNNVCKNGRDIFAKYHSTIGEIDDDFHPYNFASFLQHSISYSPLIDFSKRLGVAASFSVGNYSHVNDFNSKDSSIFVLSLFNKTDKMITTLEAADRFLNNFSVYVSKEKITLGSRTPFERRDSAGRVVGRKELDFSTFDHVIELLAPKYVLFDLPTNDRMKYQCGTFVMFYDFLMVNGSVLYNLSSDFHVVKMIVPSLNSGKNTKNMIIDEIKTKYPQYEMTYLMDPYAYFTQK